MDKGCLVNFIKQWYNHYRRKTVLKDIKKAKQYYIDGIESFMCLCFKRVNYSKYHNYESIHKLIPEFTREYLGSYIDKKYTIWWLAYDKESRIKAFDKLIEIYST